MIDNYSKSSVFSGSNKNAINCSFNSVRILCVPLKQNLILIFVLRLVHVISCTYIYSF